MENKVKAIGIGGVPTLNQVFKKAEQNKKSDAYKKIQEAQRIEAQRLREAEEMKKDPYTIITSKDLIDIFAEYNVPVARQTVDFIQKQKIFYIKGELDVVRR